MRILVVSHGHPSFSLGGAEIASYNLHKGFQASAEVDTHYLARVGAPTPRHAGTALMSLRQRGGELLYYAEEYDHFLISNRATEEIERDFVRVLRDLKPDVVHFHHFIGLGLECLFAVRDTLPDALIVVTFHEYLSICHHHGQMVKTGAFKLCYRSSPSDCNACFPEIAPARFLARETFIKGILNLADHFVSPSRFLAERYQQWGLAAERFSVIENGIDVAEVAPPRPLPDSERRRSRFAYFGQLTPYKGADILLDAVTRIPDSAWGEDGVLLVYGGNLDRQPEAYKKKFADLVEAAGRRVRFCGAFQNHEMPNLMRSVDWVVMPSVWWENSPIVIQEAFFHGRPILSSNLGGMAEKITDEVDGLHFRSGSPEDLVDCMTRALSEPGLWERLRSGIKKPLSHVDCANQHLALYQRLIAARGMPAPANRAAAPLIA